MLKKYKAFIAAFILTVPGLALAISSIHMSPPTMAILCGVAILGASFLLTWACEVSQMDMPQALAVAIVAFIAVLPEYAVDMYFTWMAGKHPESSYSHYAIANMTGANRLLIGVGWAAIAILFAFRYHHGITLDNEKRTDILFLAMATLYALILPLKGSLTILDGAVFLAIYVWYVLIIVRRPCAEEEPAGPAAAIAMLSKGKRVASTIALFIFAAIVILFNAEPFSENLVSSGKILGINEFLLVQWLAPIASEAPEFIIALMFAFRGNASIALGSLLSSKLNQWTLLVGMIPGVYAVSLGSVSTPINMDANQFSEIFLTAAQSIFAVAILLNLKLSAKEGWILLVLFCAQLTSPLYKIYVEDIFGLTHNPLILHNIFAWLYISLAIVVGLSQWRLLKLLPNCFKV